MCCSCALYQARRGRCTRSTSRVTWLSWSLSFKPATHSAALPRARTFGATLSAPGLLASDTSRCVPLRTAQVPRFFDPCHFKSPLLSLLKKSRRAPNKTTPHSLVSQVKENLVDMKSDSVKFSPQGTRHYYIPHQSWHCFSNNCISRSTDTAMSAR